MLTIRDLIEQFEVQGKYQIATYDNETEKRKTLAEGYEVKISKNTRKYMDAEIIYMYAENNVLVIEINS